MKPFTSKHCAQYLTKESPLSQGISASTAKNMAIAAENADPVGEAVSLVKEANNLSYGKNQNDELTQKVAESKLQKARKISSSFTPEGKDQFVKRYKETK
jgi:hypothetical protein